MAGSELHELLVVLGQRDQCEHVQDDGFGWTLEKVNKASVARPKGIKCDPEAEDEVNALNAWLKLDNDEAARKKAIKRQSPG